MRTQTVLDILMLSLGALLVAASPAGAQSGDRPPLRAEVDFAGGFVRLAGNALTDATVDTLSVRRWRPGLSVGVGVRRWLEVVATAKPGLDLRLEEPWGFGETKDGRAVVDHQTGAIYGTEARFFPFAIDVYGAVGVLHARPTSYAMTVTRTGPTLGLGGAQHATDVDAAWRSKGHTTLSVGLGYSRRTRSGLTLSIGLSVPVAFPANGPMQLTFSPGVAVPASDRQAAAAILDREVFYAPLAFQIGIGWSF